MKKNYIILFIVDLVIVALGPIMDIVFWTYFKDPSVPGHGVPFFFFIGIILAIIFNIIYMVIIKIKKR